MPIKLAHEVRSVFSGDKSLGHLREPTPIHVKPIMLNRAYENWFYLNRKGAAMHKAGAMQWYAINHPHSHQCNKNPIWIGARDTFWRQIKSSTAFNVNKRLGGLCESQKKGQQYLGVLSDKHLRALRFMMEGQEIEMPACWKSFIQFCCYKIVINRLVALFHSISLQ